MDVSTIKKLVVIDSTWQQTKQILRDEKIKGIPCVKLEPQQTKFWRYQDKGDDHLATVEGTPH
jgi:DTW domain-containing protein YfiP